jgi:hypothetical protein
MACIRNGKPSSYIREELAEAEWEKGREREEREMHVGVEE